MNKRILIAALSVAAATALAAHAQTGTVVVEKAPGTAAAMQTVRATATITAIDPKTREVTLKGPQGNEVTIEAGPQVKNFAQMEVGDLVNIEYVEALTLELKKGGGQPVAKTTQLGEAGAASGAMPAGIRGRQITVVADVTALNAATQTITLRGPQRTVELKVPDPEQFKRVAMGDQVEATYTEALAVRVERAKDVAGTK
jgi:Cu/Ag efflux protein CusF